MMILGTLVVGSNALAADPDIPPSSEIQSYLTPPSVIDKLLSAEAILGPSMKLYSENDWGPVYDQLYAKFNVQADTDALSKRGQAVLAMSLGVKATDGVLALKARNTEELNTCAEEIEKLAQKLDVPPEQLKTAALIKHDALEKQWIEAFMQLGYLQQSVTEYLEDNPKQKDEGLLIILGGWLQGGRCVTSLILDHYTEHASNVLREPLLVKKMAQMANDMRPEYKDDPVVKEVMTFLPLVQAKLNVGLHDPIPQKDVQWMHGEFERLVLLITQSSSAKAQ